jgi:hypothetical protein
VTSTETAELIPIEPETKTAVYASKGGDRYHANENCPALYSGQELFGGWGTFATYRATEITITESLGQGRMPCHACLPGSAAALFRSNCEDDFGHEPVEIDGDWFCPRCRDRGVDEYGDAWTYPTLWPCTSATVLGLVPRTDEQEAALRKVVHGCETPESHNWGCPCETTTPAS